MEILPGWDNSSEYESLNSSGFKADWEKANAALNQIKDLNKLLENSDQKVKIKALQDIAKVAEEGQALLSNLYTFTRCETNVDSKNEAGQKFAAQARQLFAAYGSAMVAYEIFLKECDEETLHDFLQAPHTKPASFFWNNERRMKPYLLSADEEKTVSEFSPYSLSGWGELYSQISGSLTVHVPSKGDMGVAQAAGLLRSADENLRREAWQGIQAAWKNVEVPCAAVINNIVGYRLELYKKRSHTKNMHFLDMPLFESQIEAATLNAMMDAVQKNIEVPRRALKAMAKALKKPKVDPWDILAPSPRVAVGSQYPFSEGLSLVRDAFASVHPSMGEFVDMMVKNKWVEARVLPNKGAGAHCTEFSKSRTPRVFQSYMGSMKDISTLAHELGHAYHAWVMREQPLIESNYPMTVAETASTFSETLLSERLFAKAQGDEKFTIAWEDASDAVAMLVNIPARFEFEKNFYAARANGPLSAKELSAMTDQAWRKWYGDELSQTEEQYWMTKAHFNFSGISFYNYPYTFGYLFSLGIYATKEKWGDKFHKAYVELLQDSGRMTAEDLVQKHLGADIRQPQFWQDSINIIESKISAFEKLV